MSLRRYELGTEGRYSGVVVALIWLFFMVIPAAGLRCAVRMWLQDEENGLRAVARRQLVEEMRVFKDELGTSQALNDLYRPVMDEFGFNSNISEASAAALMKFGKADFELLCASVFKRTGSKPAVSALLIPSKKKVFILADPFSFPGRTPAEIETEITAILKPLMNNCTSRETRTREFAAEVKSSQNRSEALFGGDFNFAVANREMRLDVAHFNGTANVYSVADWACVNPECEEYSSKSCAALFISLFHGRNIDQTALIRKPLGRSLYPSFHRRIEYVRPCDLPRFADNGATIALQDTPPMEWPDDVLLRVAGRDRKPGFRPILAVYADPALSRHPWRNRLPWFDIGLFLALAGTALMCIRFAWFHASIGSGLRRRIAWGFAFGAMVPCCGLILLATASAKAGENRQPQAVIAHMSRQLERLDNGLRIARVIRAKTLQTWYRRISAMAGTRDDSIEKSLKDMLARLLSRVILLYFADGRDFVISDYRDQATTSPMRSFMKGTSWNALVKLGGVSSQGGFGSERKMSVGIDIAQTITSEYLDDSYSKELLAYAPLLLANPFGNMHQFMGVQIVPPPNTKTRPNMLAVTYGGWSTITDQYFMRLMKRSPPEFAERRSSWNIKYYIYPVNSYNPPELSSNDLSFEPRGWNRYGRLAEVCLRQRMGRGYDKIPDEAETLATTRLFAHGNVVGVAVAIPGSRKSGPGWAEAMFAIAAAWAAVTLSTAFFLTLPFPVFLDATRMTARGEYGWSISLDRPDEFGDLAGVFNNMARGLRERAGMARFVSEGVLTAVREAESQTVKMASGGERIEAAVLFSDIRGFTTLSEANDPEDVVTLLNDYFTMMEEPITAAGGSIETYLGDAILAVFPPRPGTLPPEICAVNAAFGMRAALDEFNASRTRDGRFTIETGIGVAAGPIIWGRLGGEDGRLLPTLLGLPADRASKCEAATKGMGGSGIIVDATVWSRLAGRYAGRKLTVEGDVMRLLNPPG